MEFVAQSGRSLARRSHRSGTGAGRARWPTPSVRTPAAREYGTPRATFFIAGTARRPRGRTGGRRVVGRGAATASWEVAPGQGVVRAEKATRAITVSLATVWTRCRDRVGRRYWCGRFKRRSGGSERGRELLAQLQARRSRVRPPEAVVADFVKPTRQHVLQEAVQKLLTAQRHRAPRARGRVLIAERDGGRIDPRSADR